MPIPVGFRYHRGSSAEEIIKRMYGEADWLATAELSMLKERGEIKRIGGNIDLAISWSEGIEENGILVGLQGCGGIEIGLPDLDLLSLAPYNLGSVFNKRELYRKWGLDLRYDEDIHAFQILSGEESIGFYFGATGLNNFRFTLPYTEKDSVLVKPYKYLVGSAMALSEYPDLFSEASQRGIVAGFTEDLNCLGIAVPWKIVREYIAEKSYAESLPRDLLYPFVFPFGSGVNENDLVMKRDVLRNISNQFNPVVVRTDQAHHFQA